MTPSFQKQLQTLLQWWAAQTDHPLRIAVVGIGSELRGDDAAGVVVIRRLRKRIPARPDILLVDGGSAPENVTGIVRRFQADGILLVDAGSFGEKPGSLRLCGCEEARGFSASAHTMPLASFARYLESDQDCRTALVLIQPEQMVFDQGMSTAVKRATARAANALVNALTRS